jgi:hypothetical protein
MRLGLATMAAVAVLTACDDVTGPLPDDGRVRVRAELVDARNGGVSGFYFLPPLAPAVAYAGVFDATRTPSVEICVLAGDQCGAIMARFSSSGSGAEHVRADLQNQNYIVQWKTTQAGLSLTPVYRIRVIDGAELGHADVKLIRKGNDAKSLPAGITGVILGATLPIKFRIEQSSGGAPARLEVHPGTFLLPGAGSSLQLEVRAFDANGNPTSPGAVTWHSTKPGVLAMSANGVANAVAAGGSAQVTAQAGNLVSPPVLGIVSAVAHDAFLVSDANVMTPPATSNLMSVAGDAKTVIFAVDPAQAYKPGWQFRFYLAGAAPSVGQVVIGQGEAPIGGRVTGLEPVSGGTQVTASLISLSELLPGLQIDETLSLEHAPVTVSPALRSTYDVQQDARGGMQFRPRITPTFEFARALESSMTHSSVLASESEFQLGPFECTVETSGLSVVPTVLNPSFHVDPDLSLDIVYTSSGLQKLVVHGSVDAGAGENPVFPVEVEQKLECKVELASVNIPISGPVSLFFGGQVPFGVGFEIDAKMSVGNFGVDMSVSAGASLTLGIDCTAGCSPVATLTGSATGTLKPTIPDFTNGIRSELKAGAFVWAGFAVGNPVIEALQFEAFEAKAGLTQSFELAPPVAQVSDATYASSFQISFDVEAGTANDVEELAELLSIQLPPLKFENSSELASSPKVQAFTISPSSVQAASSSSAGEEASFILTLDPVLYVGAYAVDSVELFRKKPGIGGAFILEIVPGQCGRIAPSSGQSAFTCASTLPASWAGDQTIYAFVKARLFGVSLPVLLEAGPDAKATINVTAPPAVSVSIDPAAVTLAAGASQQFVATVAGTSNQSVTWTATAGSITPAGLYTAGASNATVTATSVADPTKSASAAVTIGTAATMDYYADYSFGAHALENLPAVCYNPATGFGVKPPDPPGSFSSDCAATWLDPQHGDSYQGASSLTASYSVYSAPDGSQVIDFVGLASASATHALGPNTPPSYETASGNASADMNVCFVVPSDRSYAFRLSGSLVAPGLVGLQSNSQATVQFVNQGRVGAFNVTFTAGSAANLPSPKVVDYTGVFAPGARACVRATVFASASVRGGSAELSASFDSLTLRLTPQ